MAEDWDVSMAAAAGQPLPAPEWLGAPSRLRVRPLPAVTGPMSAPQQTAAQDFREGMEDFGTRALGAAALGFDDEIAGALTAAGGGSYSDGRDAHRARQRAADERSPRAALAGDIAGGVVAPGSAAALAAGAVGASEAKNLKGLLQEALVQGAVAKAMGRSLPPTTAVTVPHRKVPAHMAPVGAEKNVGFVVPRSAPKPVAPMPVASVNTWDELQAWMAEQNRQPRPRPVAEAYEAAISGNAPPSPLPLENAPPVGSGVRTGR